MATRQSPSAETPARRAFAQDTAAFRDGSDTPRDYLERCIAAIEVWEPRIGAFVASNIESARAAADRATARWKNGKPLSAIDGMPVGIKDIMETADMPTEQGSPLFAGWRGGRDCAAVAALREAAEDYTGRESISRSLTPPRRASIGARAHASRSPQAGPRAASRSAPASAPARCSMARGRRHAPAV